MVVSVEVRTEQTIRLYSVFISSSYHDYTVGTSVVPTGLACVMCRGGRSSFQTAHKVRGVKLKNLRMKLSVNLFKPHCICMYFVFLHQGVQTRECVPELLHRVPPNHQDQHVEIPGVPRGTNSEEVGLEQFEKKWRVKPILHQNTQPINSKRRKWEKKKTVTFGPQYRNKYLPGLMTFLDLINSKNSGWIITTVMNWMLLANLVIPEWLPWPFSQDSSLFSHVQFTWSRSELPAGRTALSHTGSQRLLRDSLAADERKVLRVSRDDCENTIEGSKTNL